MTFLRIYDKHSRNWCGLRLTIPIAIACIPPLLIIILVYYEATSLLTTYVAPSFAKHYLIPITFVAALIGKVLHHLLHKRYLHKWELSSVETRIEAKKRDLVTFFSESDPSAQPTPQERIDHLVLAVRTADLGAERKGLLKKLVPNPTPEGVAEVVRALGVSISKSIKQDCMPTKRTP